MADFLAGILARKRDEIDRLHRPTAAELAAAPPARSLHAALTGADGTAVIAEVKRASPSAGVLAADLDAATQAARYAAAGAAAVSVLTDGPGFGGAFTDLTTARAAAPQTPLLCKDFLISAAQLETARIHGADATLLIVAALQTADRLRELIDTAAALGMDALVEVHDEAELEVALEAGSRIVGINNRDLRTFTIDLGTGERLAKLLPSDVVAVAESGIRKASDAERLVRAGARAVLVGEALVRADDPAILIAELRGLAQ